MGIRDISPANFIVPYKRPRFGSVEAEEAWKQRNAKRREKQTVIAEVAEACSVETVRGTTLRDGEQVTPADVGGQVNLTRLRSVGAVNMVTANQAKTNAGGFEFTALRSFTHNGRIYDVAEGFSAEELDVPGTEPSQAVTVDGRIVEHPGRPPVDGAKLTEQLVKNGLAERAKLTDKVRQAAKRVLKGSKTKAAG